MYPTPTKKTSINPSISSSGPYCCKTIVTKVRVNSQQLLLVHIIVYILQVRLYATLYNVQYVHALRLSNPWFFFYSAFYVSEIYTHNTPSRIL